MAIKTIPLIEWGTKKAQTQLKRITSGTASRSIEIVRAVEGVLEDILEKGDSALFAYSKRFDGMKLSSKNVRLSSEYIKAQAQKVPNNLKATMRQAAKRVRAYHRKQKIDTTFTLKTAEGTLAQITRPLSRVAVYIPGGYTVYPSSVLMSVIPAQIAGVKEIVAVTPPRKELNPHIAFVLDMLKVNEVYQVGGAQAVGALAYGTKSIPAVDKIVGPGNSYVAMAKKMVYGTVDIDCVAGPSEVVVLADSSANPLWVALDLLSQAEHGSGDETAVLVTEDRAFAQAVQECVKKEIMQSPVRDVIEALPAHGITIFVCNSRQESIECVNLLAPEHLQIITTTYKQDLKKIQNASAIFLGAHTPVALGDYFVGTNHVLPTGGAARYASPLGVDSFIKRISVAEASKKGLAECAPHVSRFARAERFVHHALSVERRVSGENK